MKFLSLCSSGIAMQAFNATYSVIHYCVYAGEYHCPVLNKVFTEFTHIVAVKTTGNVFCYEVLFFVLHFLFPDVNPLLSWHKFTIRYFVGY